MGLGRLGLGPLPFRPALGPVACVLQDIGEPIKGLVGLQLKDLDKDRVFLLLREFVRHV